MPGNHAFGKLTTKSITCRFLGCKHDDLSRMLGPLRELGLADCMPDEASGARGGSGRLCIDSRVAASQGHQFTDLSQPCMKRWTEDAAVKPHQVVVRA